MDLHLSSVPAACRFAAIAAAACLLVPVAAMGEPLAVRLSCTSHGANTPDPLPDRQGQSLLAGSSTCLIQGGPMDGAVETQNNLWHYDAGRGTLLSSHTVARKPGALSAAQITEGTMTFQTTEGRVTGWSATGGGRMTLATGGGAALAGKRFNWKASPTGPRSYVIDVAFEP